MGVATTPAEMSGSMVVEKLVTTKIPRSISLQWLANSRLMRHLPIMRALMPSKIGLGSRTVNQWVVTSVESGSLKSLTDNGRLVPMKNGTHLLNKSTTRVTINTKPTPRSGLGGFAGAAAWAAWIDGFTQLFGDWNACLSNMQKANRFAVALTLGLAGGVAAGLAFAAATGGVAALAAAGIIASPLIIAAVPILVGIGVGYGFSALIGNPLKETWFRQNPQWFGAP